MGRFIWYLQKYKIVLYVDLEIYPKSKEKEMDHPGSVVIIANASCTKLILQRKDNAHPIPQYQGAFSLFGGSLEGRETPKEGLMRELDEEILDAILIKNIAQAVTFWKTYVLHGTIYPTYTCHIFVAQIDDKTFDTWSQRIAQSSITEGFAYATNRDELERLLNSDTFVGSLDIVLQDWLAANPPQLASQK